MDMLKKMASEYEKYCQKERIRLPFGALDFTLQDGKRLRNPFGLPISSLELKGYRTPQGETTYPEKEYLWIPEDYFSEPHYASRLVLSEESDARFCIDRTNYKGMLDGHYFGNNYRWRLKRISVHDSSLDIILRNLGYGLSKKHEPPTVYDLSWHLLDIYADNDSTVTITLDGYSYINIEARDNSEINVRMTNPQKQELEEYVINYPHIGDANLHGASKINFLKEESGDIKPRIYGVQSIAGNNFDEYEKNRINDFFESNVRINRIV